MRIGSKASISVVHCLLENKQTRNISQDDDAFSIVIMDETRGWNSSSLFKMWKQRNYDGGLTFVDLNVMLNNECFRWPDENESENLTKQKSNL